VNIGQPLTVAAISADMDDDGDKDLLLSIAKDEQFWVLHNLSPPVMDTSSTTFSSTIGKRGYGVARDPSLNQAGLATGDFDRDGDLDVLPPAQGFGTSVKPHSEVFVYRWDRIDQTLYRPDIVGDVEYDESTRELTVEFTHSTAGLPGYPAGVGTFGLEVSMWHTSDLGQLSDVDPYAEAFLTGATWTVTMPEAYDPAQDNNLFSVIARQVALDGSTVLERGPANTAILTPANYWTTILTTEEVENKLLGEPSGDDPISAGIGPRPPGFEEEEEPGRGE
jgi:hypothetical protein